VTRAGERMCASELQKISILTAMRPCKRLYDVLNNFNFVIVIVGKTLGADSPETPTLLIWAIIFNFGT